MIESEYEYEDVAITCADGERIQARYFSATAPASDIEHVAIIAPATGVQARYYWRFANYLAGHGVTTLVPRLSRYRPLGTEHSQGVPESADSMALLGFA